MEISAQLRHAASEALRSAGPTYSFIRVYAQGHGEGTDRERRLSYVPLPVGRPSIGTSMAASDGCWSDHRDRGMSEPRVSAALREASACPAQRAPADPSWDRIDSGGGPRPESVPRAVASLELGHPGESSTDTMRGAAGSRSPRLENSSSGPLSRPASVRPWSGTRHRNAPWWAGTVFARAVRVPTHLTSWPRYHVKLELRHEIRGPLLVALQALRAGAVLLLHRKGPPNRARAVPTECASNSGSCQRVPSPA